MWFTSFELAQGYLQMAMEEEDMKKTAFRAGLSGLYEFTRMPFGSNNAGASFCHLMEMCIGDQQHITLLFYLDDIFVFAETADQMLDRIQFTFNRLKEFNLKIKPKKSFHTYFHKKECHQTQKRLKRFVIGLFQLHLRRFIPSLVWPPTIAGLSQTSRNGQALFMFL